MWFDEFKTPIGMLKIAVDEKGLRYILFESNKHQPLRIVDWKRDRSVTQDAREQLLQYFSGELNTMPAYVINDMEITALHCSRNIRNSRRLRWPCTAAAFLPAAGV